MQVSENMKANTVSSAGQVEKIGSVFFPEEKKDAELKVLFVGNSITLHGYLPDIGWYGTWGMAASSKENDYVHRTVAMLREAYGDTAFCIAQGANWERGYENTAAVLEAEYTAARDFAADIVIIRIGENVNREANAKLPIKPYFAEMVKFFASNPNAKVIVTDLFWKCDALDEQIRAAAFENGWTFVHLGDLEQDPATMALGEFEHSGVAHHPGDYGMEMIAKRLKLAIDTVM